MYHEWIHSLLFEELSIMANYPPGDLCKIYCIFVFWKWLARTVIWKLEHRGPRSSVISRSFYCIIKLICLIYHFFRVFRVQQGWISRFLLYLLISTCFVANKKPQFLKDRHFWPKLSIFWPKTHFLELLCPNNVINGYKERILGRIFTLMPNPGSKTMFWRLKKGQKLKKECFFCESWL